MTAAGGTRGMGVAALTRATHPLAPALVLTLADVVVAGGVWAGRLPVLLAWVVLALSAGYAISGSV